MKRDLFISQFWRSRNFQKTDLRTDQSQLLLSSGNGLMVDNIMVSEEITWRDRRTEDSVLFLLSNELTNQDPRRTLVSFKCTSDDLITLL